MTTENTLAVKGGPSSSLPVDSCRFDPFSPVPPENELNLPQASGTRQSQRLRRSRIYAAIRALLAEGGREKVTVRNIASASGYAVQTIYNLVGNREDAISEAIAEYKIFVGLSSAPAPEDPTALPHIIDSWFHAVSLRPDLQREANLIYFTEQRPIYYRIRDRQLREMRLFLIRQKNCGILQCDVDIDTLCELMVQYSCVSWLEWADCGYPLEILRRKIGTGFAFLLQGRLAPQHRDRVTALLTQSDT